MQSYNLTIIISLINLGFFGGFTHCGAMCGPFVLTQVSNRLQNISLAQFSRFEKLRSMALLPYHCGRITTYTFIGFFCSVITANLKEINGFNIVSGLLLLFAAAFFLKNLLGIKFNFRLPFCLPKIKNPSILTKLFQNPCGFNGFLLGIVLGFIPCGLLYGAFALCGSIANPIFAALGMFLFGIMTFPALFFTASGGYIFFKITKVNFKLISKAIILINAVTLGIMGLELIIK